MLDEIKDSFKRGNFLTRLIYINAGVFAVVKIIMVFFTLFNVSNFWVRYLELPSWLPGLLHQPWTILTYMFLHTEFLHAIFNLLALYWFGSLFLRYFNQKQLVGLYIWGGLAGALFYLLGYNLLPYFAAMRHSSYLLGASASIMALLFAIVTLRPNDPIRIPLIGDIKLKYIGLIFIFIDLAGTTSMNAGGSIAHIGGIVMGIVYTLLLNKNIDLCRPVSAVIDWIVVHWHCPKREGRSSWSWANLKNKFRRQPKMKVHVNKTQQQTDAQWNKEHKKQQKADDATIDSILEKIKKTGYQNLTAEEKQILFDLSNKRK